MSGGKLKDAATICILRSVDASKCVCGTGGAYSAPPDSAPPDYLTGFVAFVGREGGMKRLEMKRKGKGRGRKGRGGKGDEERAMEFRGTLGGE